MDGRPRWLRRVRNGRWRADVAGDHRPARVGRRQPVRAPHYRHANRCARDPQWPLRGRRDHRRGVRDRPAGAARTDGFAADERNTLMQQRKIGLLLGAAALTAALAVGTLATGFAQGAPQPGYGPGGMMNRGGSSTTTGFGPGGMMGGAGSTTTGGQGYGPGGMMGGQGFGPGMMNGWGQSTPTQAHPITSLDDAKQDFQRYIDTTGNSNLALDEVIQFQWNYYAIVKDTSTGQGAFELLANPQTGAVFPEMGPNMMWNTQYGQMGGIGMMGGQRQIGQPTVSADQAQQIAQQWLDQNQPGSATETPDAFPGYYTFHFTRDGQISGMLSVNAFTGAVWYHGWHGAFVSSSEAYRTARSANGRRREILVIQPDSINQTGLASSFRPSMSAVAGCS